MARPNISIDTFLADLGARVGTNYTEEQRELMKDFTSPVISFSSPGTGKTKTAIGGLLTTELYHQIPGDNIYALSFTRLATVELALRHEHECRQCGIAQTVHFQTLHSLCRKVLVENHNLLGISRLDVGDSLSVDGIKDVLRAYAEDKGITILPWQYRPFIRAVRDLNSSLVFDRVHVESKYSFKQCKLTYEDFTYLRKCIYDYAKLTNTIYVHDIPLYALEILTSHPEVSAEFKKKCRVLLVDEFQDLSLLQLRIITLLSDNVVAIGDIKQQIYAFNGACQEIVSEFKKYYPTARECNLNVSFRCAEPIIEFSKMIIKPNKMNEQDFRGMGKEGSVKVTDNMSLSDVCDIIEKQYRENRNIFPRSSMFLFRNNYSATPVAEELFKRKIPFRIQDYTPANAIKVIHEMCCVVELAANPSNLNNINALRYILPEQQRYPNYTQSPLYQVCVKEGCSVFDAPYQFKDAMAAREAMELLLRVKDMLGTGAYMKDILNAIYPLFYRVYLKNREPYLEMPVGYYIRTVQPLVHSKTYFQFVSDENAKAQIIQDSNARRHGVRCYTFHGSKGLEADDVYILDAEDAIIPSQSHLYEMEKAGCVLEKARDIRNERSLLFVAATRAKENLYITYYGEKSSMLTPINVYERYDDLYNTCQTMYPDVEAFEEFYKGGR